MRVTMNTIMRQYNTRLNSVLGGLNSAGDRVTTGRKYSKASQDPSSAVRSSKLRREYLKNDDYLVNLRDVQGRFDSVESGMMNVSKVAEDAYIDVLTAVNGTINPDQRAAIANKLREMQKTMVKEMNTSEAGEFIFGGTSSKETPFNLDASGNLLYRGIDVTNGDPAVLKQLSEQAIYMDLGFGLEVDAAGNINPNTAFNMATPGINFLGFGKNTDGSSKNIVVLLGEIANEIEKPEYDAKKLEDLSKELDTQRNNIIINVTKLGSNTMFLEYTGKRLEDSGFNYNQKIYNTEFMKPEEAITDFKTQDYIYRATLKVGMDILSPSFIDFMR